MTENFQRRGPIGKFFSKEALLEIMKKTNSEVGDSIFMACGKLNELEKITALARDKIAQDLDLIDEDIFAFCWIVDYPCLKETKQQIKSDLVTILFLCLKVI
jgi:aspartyl-tRNA synthetase